LIITLVFEKNANFSLKIVIITSTPGYYMCLKTNPAATLFQQLQISLSLLKVICWIGPALWKIPVELSKSETHKEKFNTTIFAIRQNFTIALYV
jgi:hypothetical protein